MGTKGVAQRRLADTGLTFDDVPEELVSAAEELGLPLLEIPLRTPFAAVVQRVSSRIAALQYDAVLRASRAQPRITRAVVSGGPQEVAAELGRALRASVVVLDPSGTVIASHPRNLNVTTVNQVRDASARMPLESHWTNRIHRDDLARAIVHVAELGDLAEQLYLVTDNEPAQLEDIFTFLAGELDLPIPPAAAEPAARRAADRRIDNSKLLSTGFTLAFPGYREGYRSVLAGESSRHP